MKENLNKDFKEYCNEDIEELLEEINKYLPNLKTWQLNKSVILEEDKQILCKSILNKDNKQIGYQINIKILFDTLYKYQLIILENSIELTKNYFIENEFITEYYKTELNKEIIKRVCTYQEGNTCFKYKENNEKKETTYQKSFNEIIENLKKNNSNNRQHKK